MLCNWLGPYMPIYKYDIIYSNIIVTETTYYQTGQLNENIAFIYFFGIYPFEV